MSTILGTFINEVAYPNCVGDSVPPLFGTEYEIEDIEDINFDTYLHGCVTVVNDGSLRNNGKEFITKPQTYDDSLRTFTRLHNALTLGENPYTHRTSIHVHLNVLNMTVDELKHMTLLYALLEPVFFAYAGQARKQNIHCVPLNYTLLPKYYKENVSKLISAWSKYSAYNLLPIKKYGTVEFRHLFGTGDIEVYQQWLQMIRDLYVFCRSTHPDDLKKALNKHTPYTQIQQAVLPSTLGIIPPADEVEASLIDVKLAFI